MLDQLSGPVERVTYYNEETGYSVIRLEPSEGQGAGRADLVTVVGNLPEVNPGESLRLEGVWSNHPQYGRQFKAEVCHQVLPATVEFIGDDYADKNATMMSPRHFKEFILPGLQRCVDAAHEAGAYVVKHTDGNIMGILDMVVGTGIDALNPLEPQAGMDIGLIKQRYGDRTALIGNIDCGYVLSQAPLDEVRRTTRETIRKAAPGGGYCLSSSNSIHSSVKPENFMAMIDTWRQVGEYPIHD